MRRASLWLCAFWDGATLLLLLILPGHAYAWMRDMDPTMTQLPLDESRGLRIGVTGLAVLISLAAHVRLQQVQRRRPMHLVVPAVLIAIWGYRFLMPA